MKLLSFVWWRPLCVLALSLAGAAPACADGAGRLVLRDDFSDASSGWLDRAATRDSDQGFAVYTDSGQYQMTPVQDDTYGVVSAPRQAESPDVEVAADLFLYAGIGRGAGGVACRIQDLHNFYAFIARGDGGIVIVRVVDGHATTLAEGRIDQVLAGAVETRLSARCMGAELTLAAGDRPAITARDSTHERGAAGLLVLGEKLAGTSASFDNFALRAID